MPQHKLPHPPEQPLTILLGPDEELVLLSGEIVAGLVEFELNAREHGPVETRYVCVNCFPRPSGHRVPELGKYPLHIYAGDNGADVLVAHQGKPIGMLSALRIQLSTTRKRIVRLTSHKPFPEELEVALLDLGVETILVHPDLPAHGAPNAPL